MKTFAAALAVAICLVLAAGCGNRAKVAQQAAPSKAAERRSIRLKADDSLINLATAWAEAYGREHPEARVEVMAIKPTGSATPRTLDGLEKGNFDAVVTFTSVAPSR